MPTSHYEPPLKLVLIEHASARGTGVTGALNHLGIEVPSPEDVRSATGRLSSKGLSTDFEEQTNVLLRRTGQGLGVRSGRRPLGGVIPSSRTLPSTPASPATAAAAAGRRGRHDQNRGRGFASPTDAAEGAEPALIEA